MVEFFPERRFSVEELQNIVAGKNTSIPRTEAIVLLASSNFPNKEYDFESLLGNQEESSTIRYLAAMSLLKINTPDARMILARNTQTRDDEVLAGIMIALGRIGNEQSLGVILDVKGRTTGFTASQAEFAAALISYRLGLPGNDLPTQIAGLLKSSKRCPTYANFKSKR